MKIGWKESRVTNQVFSFNLMRLVHNKKGRDSSLPFDLD
jgi:hypothetical protein